MTGVRISGLSKFYQVKDKSIRALDGLNLEAPAGGVVSVVGRSGCGKTTLLRNLGGLEAPDMGRVEFLDEDLRPCGQGRIGMVFQEPRLLPWLNVEANMALALRHVETDEPRKSVVSRVLKIIGIPEFKDAYPHQLSGGMAQRVALGRALCRMPDLLLMDEPFGALDALTRLHLQGELMDIHRKTGITIFFVTHDVNEAVLLGGKVAVIEKGRAAHEIEVPLPYPRNISSKEFTGIRDRVLNLILDTHANQSEDKE